MTDFNETNWSTKVKLECIQRELGWRYKVYPKRVAEGRMTEIQAKREISIMEAIAADLRAELEQELRNELLL